METTSKISTSSRKHSSRLMPVLPVDFQCRKQGRTGLWCGTTTDYNQDVTQSPTNHSVEMAPCQGQGGTGHGEHDQNDDARLECDFDTTGDEEGGVTIEMAACQGQGGTGSFQGHGDHLEPRDEGGDSRTYECGFDSPECSFQGHHDYLQRLDEDNDSTTYECGFDAPEYSFQGHVLLPDCFRNGVGCCNASVVPPILYSKWDTKDAKMGHNAITTEVSFQDPDHFLGISAMLNQTPQSRMSAYIDKTLRHNSQHSAVPDVVQPSFFMDVRNRMCSL